MNPVRGEVPLVVGAVTYKLKLTTDAICSAEAEGRRAFLAMMAELHWYLHARLMLWAALQEFHPEIDKKGAGAIIDAIGITKAADAIVEAYKAAFPKEAADKAEEKPDPQ